VLELDNVFVGLHEASQYFRLTGSRFFGWPTSVSDWDFFAEDTYETRNLLMDLGFSDVSRDGVSNEKHPTYSDPLCTGVFFHPDGIHVQLVNDFITKMMAQKIIAEENLLSSPMTKENQRIVWRSVIATLNRLERVGMVGDKQTNNT